MAAFLAFVYIFSSMELFLFGHPRYFSYSYGSVGIIWIGLKIYNDAVLSRKLPIIYEEEPGPALVMLPDVR